MQGTKLCNKYAHEKKSNVSFEIESNFLCVNFYVERDVGSADVVETRLKNARVFSAAFYAQLAGKNRCVQGYPEKG